jgi:hypothetical protein
MAPPNTPTISLTAASGGFTVTIDGDLGATHYLYYRGNESAWVTGSNRSGDGTIVVTELTEYCQYDVCVQSLGLLPAEYSVPAFGVVTTSGTPVTDIEQALYWKLANTTAITDIVSTKIYPVNVPYASAEPYIVYDKVSGAREEIMGGKSGIARPVFQITSWATTYAAAKELGELVRLALDGTTETTWSGLRILAVNLTDDGEEYESFVDDSGKQVFSARQSYEIWHEESIS